LVCDLGRDNCHNKGCEGVCDQGEPCKCKCTCDPSGGGNIGGSGSGGGGSSGGTLPSTPEILTIDPEATPLGSADLGDPSDDDIVIIEEDEVPLGAPNFPEEPSDSSIIEIDDEIVPLGAPNIPQTGVSEIMLYVWGIGLLSSFLAAISLLGVRRRIKLSR
jgi:hypothetical protein